MMRGKRPRPLLPCGNKASFLWNMDAVNPGYAVSHLDPPPAIFTDSTTTSFPVSSKSPVSPSVPHRVVIGFELVSSPSENKQSDVCESPRSVLDQNALKSTVFRSPLGSLLSSCQESDLMIASIVHPSAGVKVVAQDVPHNQASPKQQEARIRTVQNSSSSKFENSHLNVEVSNGVVNGHGGVVRVDQNQQEFRVQPVQNLSNNHVDDDTPNIAFLDHGTLMEDVKCINENKSIFFTGSPPLVCCSRRETMEFLKYCCFCDSRLEGKDVFMYRGDQAFCSAECRYQKIVNDEHMEGKSVKLAAHFNPAAAIDYRRF